MPRSVSLETGALRIPTNFATTWLNLTLQIPTATAFGILYRAICSLTATIMGFEILQKFCSSLNRTATTREPLIVVTLLAHRSMRIHMQIWLLPANRLLLKFQFIWTHHLPCASALKPSVIWASHIKASGSMRTWKVWRRCVSRAHSAIGLAMREPLPERLH